MQELKKIDVLSFAVVLGLVAAVFGLVMGILIAIFGSGFGGLMGMSGVVAGAFGAAAIVLFPIVGFIEGFIGGAIFAIVYNFVASHYRGIRINLETAKK